MKPHDRAARAAKLRGLPEVEITCNFYLMLHHLCPVDTFDDNADYFTGTFQALSFYRTVIQAAADHVVNLQDPFFIHAMQCADKLFHRHASETAAMVNTGKMKRNEAFKQLWKNILIASIDEALLTFKSNTNQQTIFTT